MADAATTACSIMEQPIVEHKAGFVEYGWGKNKGFFFNDQLSNARPASAPVRRFVYMLLRQQEDDAVRSNIFSVLILSNFLCIRTKRQLVDLSCV